MNDAEILLYEIREELELTTEDVAKLSGISESSIKRYEAGITDPPLKKLAQIAHALGYSVHDLIKDDFKVQE